MKCEDLRHKWFSFFILNFTVIIINEIISFIYCRVKQILNFKIYPTDKDTLWAKSVVDNDYEILCLSDVSLYYNTKGRFKPLFYNAMDSENAKVFFYSFVNELKQSYKPNKVRRKCLEQIFLKYRN